MKNTQSKTKAKDFSKISKAAVKKLTVDTTKLTEQQIRDIFHKSLTALSAKERPFVDLKSEKEINTFVKIFKRQQMGSIFETLQSNARKNMRRSGAGTADDLYKRFKTETPQVYAKYNSYMYRNGFSASQWFKDEANRTTTVKGSYVTAVITLPNIGNDKRVTYSTLTITYDYSGHDFSANLA